MSQATIAPAEIRTLGDLLRRLGGIPLDRIRFDPPPGSAMEEDLIAIQGRKEGLFELVNGCIVEKAMGCREATVTSLLIASVGGYLRGNDLGFGVGPNCLFRVGGGVVRSPSLAFIAWDKLPRRRVPRGDHRPRPGPGRRDPPKRQHPGRNPSQAGRILRRRGPTRLGDRSGQPDGQTVSSNPRIDPGPRAPVARRRRRVAGLHRPARRPLQAPRGRVTAPAIGHRTAPHSAAQPCPKPGSVSE